MAGLLVMSNIGLHLCAQGLHNSGKLADDRSDGKEERQSKRISAISLSVTAFRWQSSVQIAAYPGEESLLAATCGIFTFK